MILKHANTLDEKELALINSWQEKRQKVDRPTWHEYFLSLCDVISTRSLDAQTQFGAIIVTPDHRIISTGYNSHIADIPGNILPNLRPEKYDFFPHAEMNAILACAKHGQPTNGCFLYVNGRPCIQCLQAIHQSGIKKIFFSNQKKAHMNTGSDAIFQILLHLTNLEVIEILPDKIED